VEQTNNDRLAVTKASYTSGGGGLKRRKAKRGAGERRGQKAEEISASLTTGRQVRASRISDLG